MTIDIAQLLRPWPVVRKSSQCRTAQRGCRPLYTGGGVGGSLGDIVRGSQELAAWETSTIPHLLFGASASCADRSLLHFFRTEARMPIDDNNGLELEVRNALLTTRAIAACPFHP